MVISFGIAYVKPLFFETMGWNDSIQLVDWVEPIWPFDRGGHEQYFAITA